MERGVWTARNGRDWTTADCWGYGANGGSQHLGNFRHAHGRTRMPNWPLHGIQWQYADDAVRLLKQVARNCWKSNWTSESLLN